MRLVVEAETHITMKELLLDGAGWQTKDDVSDAFFRAVGAPEWHGRNTARQHRSSAIDDERIMFKSQEKA
jgi:hypothetical protein